MLTLGLKTPYEEVFGPPPKHLMKHRTSGGELEDQGKCQLETTN